MPLKPPPAPGASGWPFKHIAHAWSSARRWLALRIYSHPVWFSHDPEGFGEWYTERYEWMRTNIRDYENRVWLDADMVTIMDVHTMPTHYVRGAFRFRTLEDAMLYRMAWS